jgi:hypothetical protein
MKVISLWQPWASLIALGIKQFETRSWSTNYRGDLAIHAAKKIIPFRELFRELSAKQRDFIMDQIVHVYGNYKDMPTGKIVAVTHLTDIFPADKLACGLMNLEKACGDYSSGRFAWKLEGTMRLIEPVPTKGQQGLWNFDLEGLK